jgi:hypothetical protein
MRGGGVGVVIGVCHGWYEDMRQKLGKTLAIWSASDASLALQELRRRFTLTKHFKCTSGLDRSY